MLKIGGYKIQDENLITKKLEVFVSLEPAISVYIVSKRTNKDYTLKNLFNFIFSGEVNRVGWVI